MRHHPTNHKNYNFHFYVNDDSGESKINYKFNELLKKYLPETPFTSLEVDK